jgi:hypothetical protein
MPSIRSAARVRNYESLILIWHRLTNFGTVSGGSDHPGWGDLVWSYPGKGRYKNNNNRTIWGGGSIGIDGLGNINA